jgi:hypothetical protein
MQLGVGGRRVRIVSILLFLTAGTAVLTGCSDAWSRGQLDLLSFTNPERHNDPPDWTYLDARDVTDEVCGPVTDCVQAVRSDYLTWSKFESVDDAARYAKKLGKQAEQIDPFVVDFDGKPVTDDQRKEIIEVVSGFYASSSD